MPFTTSQESLEGISAPPDQAIVGRSRLSPWLPWLPLLLLLGLSVLVVALNLDLALARRLWSEDAGWKLADANWVHAVYRWSPLPSLVVGLTALGVGLGSWHVARFSVHRRTAWLLALTLLLGPGLLVNTVLKQHYGRPRPRQVLEFGGTHAFRPLGSPTFDTDCRSFPSGHASMGFYWLAAVVLCWRGRRKVAWVFLALALLHGGVTGFVRMAQGGHWFSDVLWSAGLVYLTALALDAMLPRRAVTTHPASAASRNE